MGMAKSQPVKTVTSMGFDKGHPKGCPFSYFFLFHLIRRNLFLKRSKLWYP